MSRVPTDRATRQCDGCKLWYTTTGIVHHLEQTQKPACIAYQEQLEAEGYESSQPSMTVSDRTPGTPSTPSSRSRSRSRLSDAAIPDYEEPQPQPFEGDFFGNYEDEAWSDFDEYQGDDGEDEDQVDQEQDAGTDDDEEDEDGQSGLEEEADNYEDEGGWEPPLDPNVGGPAPFAVEDEEDLPEELYGTDGMARRRAQEQLHINTFIDPFPCPLAGQATSAQREGTAYEQYQFDVDSEGDNPYAPFASRIDYEVAKWAKMRGPGSTAVSELLQIQQLVTLLGLSFKNLHELNHIIDNKLSSGRPRFIRREIIVGGESFEVFYRDVIACVRALYGDPEFAGILVFVPERHYADADKTIRAKLDEQKKGGTIIPIIVSSDKTQLTLFGNKTAYPVYLTIGNLPKDVRRKPGRRGQILLAYLPTSRLEHITNKAARRRVLANLFHKCMSTILKPLVHAGINGISIVSGDGATRRGHPIFAVYIGDYPEQLLVTCCKNGTCPKCDIPRDDVGNTTNTRRNLRDLKKVLNALGEADNSATAFSKACREAGIKPVRHPFWVDLPYVDIFRSITPDILHQLYQGMVKHLLAWLKAAYGAEELDARCRRIPPNHHIRLFLKGVTNLQRVPGKAHADICRFLLGLVIGLPLRDGLSPVRLIRAVRALLDFVYLARYPAHTSDTLALLEDALKRFHANKAIFVDLGIRTNWKLPKLHSLDHYLQSIRLFGSTDNYDSQYTERLHIDFAKDAYRATNHRDEFPQMTVWLERREKILRHEAYVQWRLERLADLEARHGQPPACTSHASGSRSQQPAAAPPVPGTSRLPTTLTRIKMTKWATVKALRFDHAVTHYGATYIRDALARFIVSYRDPSLTPAEIEQESLHIRYDFSRVPVYHRAKFLLGDAQGLGIMESTRDAVHAHPARRDRRNRRVPARFDTVLVNEGTGGAVGLQGYRVGRVRLIFKLPKKAYQQLLPDVVAPGHLAYVEWFTAFTQPDRIHDMYKVTRCRGNNEEILASVVEVKKFRRSCHLIAAQNVRAPPLQAMCEKYGDIVYFDALGLPIMVLGTQEIAIDLLEKRSAKYFDRRFSVMADLTGFGWFFAINPYGPQWRKARRAFSETMNANAAVQYSRGERGATLSLQTGRPGKYREHALQ
ncbi:hypothetical protein K466DRAFT_601004 [Polyporus arcularius HHB13444]|uniref:Uncharacterized protein n=1 Tax=Polyporus arcularius HHB13444 TaxID=1314778 RepID=A0A5C3P7J1_9APHY|nr:hypothetical protein K466DRAFT_601004 [Polyporus arcularius HHB13444]